MLDSTSRYAPLKNLTHKLPDGREVIYKERRFLPQGDEVPAQGTATVRSGERLDTLTARTLGDPLLFWRICDANNVMDPWVDASAAGRVLRVPRPQP